MFERYPQPPTPGNPQGGLHAWRGHGRGTGWEYPRVNITTLRRSLIAATVVAISAATLTPIATAADTYSTPAAPTNVVATASTYGITVRWTPSPTVKPVIAGYVVSGGQGSCPIFVSADRHSVITIPVVKGQTTVAPTVQAVNAYGFSPIAKADKTFAVSSLTKTKVRDDLVSLQFLQLSDLHGAIEASATGIGAAVLAGAWANDRKVNPNTLALSSGDNIGAAPQISSAFEELPAIEALNLMKLDASTFGNHEHDRTIDHVQKVIGASDFQWIVSNYSSLADLKSGAKSAAPYKVFTLGGVKVGVVGANTESTKEQVFPGNLKGASGEISISPTATSVNAAIAAAKKDGAQVIVALIHQGWTENIDGQVQGRLFDMVDQIKGAHVIYGGHSHQVYNSYKKGARAGSDVIIAEVRNAGVEYTRTTTCYNTATKKVMGSATEYIGKSAVASVTPDATTAALVKKYKDQLAPKLDVKIGQVSGVFPRGGTPAVERSGENPMGNFVSDALRAKYKTDFVLVNGGGIRDTFPAKTYTPLNTALVRPVGTTVGTFDVTVGDALTVFPFGNSVATTTITGATLWKALENGVGGAYPADGRFPQISGFKFSFDSTKPIGSRIVSVTKLDGTPIAADSTKYTIATLDYLVYGGDGYTGVFSPKESMIRDLYVDIFIDAVKAATAGGKVLAVPSADGRVKKVA